MQLGTQYYRDPNPPEKFWRKDLADIAAAGFSFIGVWIPWRYVNPEQGRWELAKYRRLLDLAHKNRLRVRVQLVPESAPDWIVREHPDTLLVNSRGQRVPLHAHGMLQLGGWPGVNPHHPVARACIDDYYRQVVGRLKDHPAILTWNVWNEIQVPLISYDPHTQAAYRAWRARRKSNPVDAPLPNPELQGSVLLADAAHLHQFAWDMSVAEGQHRVALVRQLDPARPVSMHTGRASAYLDNQDDWRVAAHADIYGNSTYNQDPFYDTLSAIKQRSLKGPGRWWLTEHSGGRMVYYYGQPWQEYNEFEQWLRALLELGHSPNFLRAEDLCRKAPARSFKVIIAPSLVVLRPGVGAALTRWVRGGGHLIAGPFTGVFDPSGWTFEKSPGDGLSGLFGLHVVQRANGERFPFTAPAATREQLAGRFLFEQVRPRRGTQVTLECAGQPAVLSRRVGRGTATYITSFVGAEQATGSKLLVAWLRGLGIRPPLEFDGPVWINTARWRRQPVAFIHNPAATPCAARIAAPGNGWRDPVEGTTFPSAEGFATVPLADRQTRLLLAVTTNVECQTQVRT